jgi:membrane protein YqaA with SNARE-associated domain
MLALIRPDAWNLPLFLHVLGATVLFGTVGVVAVAGFAIRRSTDHQLLLARVAQRTYLLGAIPAYILMRVAAQWIDNKEFPNGNEPGWVGVGFLVSDAGAVLLVVVGILLAVRRQRILLAVPLLTALYVIALGVAWVSMSGKP